ncbi:hypothetical protein [Aneurinibacillus migulanus]|uniref:Uncharacterized protein n=1 Tax=Aneurinibacillus migulanus TaxID=47500 RepID=A0A0D1WNR2_ANEMI|nr:hypothetical protein [Aneurinibacillus migulanus]KIV60330.1 hypothetical protein TS65_00720 [Aneurinibacillus migulanus]KON90470.1 hypothetical protein AF333_28695 [Aneurinibacillus migulanus]MED0894858.1 hypothetical protein [Aneurinibacillus migulanus]MED1614391.1 hypothetical protein [Aneurinibacillus migulanus]SDJ79190.1 hypothetical protein SAMN04487909_12897 [Aneurinibacillus migulanus]
MDEDLYFLIEDILEQMAVEGRSHFAPHYVCARLGVTDLKSVTEYMLDLVGKKLTVYYEVECPNGDSDYDVDSLSEITEEIRTCSICDIKYIPSLDKVWIVFNFLPGYLKHVKKKKSVQLIM